MDIIGKAFNPVQGDARAVCVQTDGFIIGLITKGKDAEQTIASFRNNMTDIDDKSWEKTKEIWESINTCSPLIMFCRNRYTSDCGLWKRSYYKNVDNVVGEYPYNSFGLESSMFGIYADMMSVSKELLNATDFIREEKFNFGSGKSLILLSTAPYKREEDWEQINKALIDAVTPLCNEKPEEHWDEVGRILADALGPDSAYVIITDADKCRERQNWNIKEGEPTGHWLKAEWSKKGFAGLYGPDYDEHASETIQARTGTLLYEGFGGLCIKEITDDRIVFLHRTEKKILTPGNSIYFCEHDGYESHDGIEYRNLTFRLGITWVQDTASVQNP